MSEDDQRYITGLIRAVGELSQQLGTVRAEVKEDMAQLLAQYRDDVHRTTMGIHARLLSYEDELIRDRAARMRRQQELDTQLGAIRDNQRWRLRIELAILVVGVMVYLWLH